MNDNQYSASRYQEMNVSTATPLHLVVMLYDAAICSLEEARVYMERNDIVNRSQAINKCNSIISELQSSLNLKEGGDIASSLNRLYNYMKTTLLRAGAEQKPGLVTEVSGLLENLRSAWRQIDGGNTASGLNTGGLQSIQDAGIIEKPPTAESEHMSSFSISA